MLLLVLIIINLLSPDFAIDKPNTHTFKPIYKVDEESKKSVDLSSVSKGGYWSPKFKPESKCGANDVEFVVFIVPLHE